jgi:hypothetical protein
MPSPTHQAKSLDQNILTGAKLVEDEIEGLAPIGPPNYHSIKDAIQSGVVDPGMAIPIPIPLTMDNFMSSLRAFELKAGGKYAIFVPEEMFDKLSQLLSQLKGLPWGGLILPAKFYPDGGVEILVGTLEQHLGWLEGNKP